jgi:hypothetical protein
VGLPFSRLERELAESVDVLAENDLGPLVDEADRSDDLHPGLVATIGISGLLRHFVPDQYGGAGLSVTSLAIIRERLAYQSVAADEFFVSQGIPIQPICLFGTENQKLTYLPALLSGKRLFSFCLTEPDAGSDVLGIQTTATAVDDGFVLNGQKRYGGPPGGLDVGGSGRSGSRDATTWQERLTRRGKAAGRARLWQDELRVRSAPPRHPTVPSVKPPGLIFCSARWSQAMFSL